MHINTNDHYQNKTSVSHSDNCKHKPHCQKDKVNKIASDICTPMHIPTKTDDIPDNSDIDSSDSTSNYA